MSNTIKQQSDGQKTIATLKSDEHHKFSGIQRAGVVYLMSVPFLTMLLGFGVGHVDPRWYLSGWLINTLMMITILYPLVKYQPSANQFCTLAALLLIVPWVIFPVFGGMGRPPQNIRRWLELAGEQHARYNLLILGSTLAYLGTALLYHWLRNKEKLFTTLGMGLMTLSIPMFVINMAYWGSFLTEAFRHFKTANRPDWYTAFQELFLLINTVEVSMIYIATAMFALALGKTGYFKAAATRAYVIISLCAALVNLFPPSAPEPFATMSYLVCVPAIPFVMFYLMGVNLLWIASTRYKSSVDVEDLKY